MAKREINNYKTMTRNNPLTWVCAIGVVALASCNIDVPEITESSFETMTVKKTDIELPIKFSAKMKGQNDVTVTPTGERSADAGLRVRGSAG